jgi:hypothetical protein
VVVEEALYDLDFGCSCMLHLPSQKRRIEKRDPFGSFFRGRGGSRVTHTKRQRARMEHTTHGLASFFIQSCMTCSTAPARKGARCAMRDLDAKAAVTQQQRQPFDGRPQADPA